MIETFADACLHAFRKRCWPAEPEASFGDLSLEESYRVQDLVTARRVAEGEVVAGYKVGCTSAAIRAQFGLREPISGRLFHPFVHEEGVNLDWTGFANCALEPEMVLQIGRDLSGADLSEEELRAGIASVRVGLEVHNYTFWQGIPTVQELVCSGGIHACLVVGSDSCSPDALTFREESFSLSINGSLRASERAEAIMGGPLQSLRWLVEFLTARGEVLPRGALVIPGSPTELIPLDEDARVEAEITGVGRVVTAFRKGGLHPEG